MYDFLLVPDIKGLKWLYMQNCQTTFNERDEFKLNESMMTSFLSSTRFLFCQALCKQDPLGLKVNTRASVLLLSLLTH